MRVGVDSRHLGWWLIGGTSAVVVLLLITGTAVVLLDRRPGEAEPRSGSILPDLPATIEMGDDAPPLPEAGPVGQGAIIYQPPRAENRLVMADGRQYVLTGYREGTPTYHFSLSPDGRWLVAIDLEPMQVRDLVSGEVRAVTGMRADILTPWAWSPDSRWLLVSELDSTIAKVTGYQLVDMAGGEAIPVAVPPGQEPVAVLESGQVVTLDQRSRGRGTDDTPSTEFSFGLFAPAAVGDDFVGHLVDAKDWLRPGETLRAFFTRAEANEQLLAAPGSDGLWLTVSDSASNSVTALLRIALSGVVRDRVEIAGPPQPDAGERWRVAGQMGGEMVVRQELPIPDEVLVRHHLLYTVSPGGLRAVTSISPVWLLQFAGATMQIV